MTFVRFYQPCLGDNDFIDGAIGSGGYGDSQEQ